MRSLNQPGLHKDFAWKKKQRGRNDLAEGPRFRTERNDLKKVRTCPALPRVT